MIEKLMQEVFEKAQKERGSQVRNAVVTHLENCLTNIFEGNMKHNPMSLKTIERYHRKYIEKQENVEGFNIPNDEFKYQLAKYLGYSNYSEYIAHFHKEDHQKNEIYIADSITKIDTHNGDIHNH